MDNIKVRMIPHPDRFDNHESGIKRVVLNYAKYLPNYGIELVAPDDNSYDLTAAHAGTNIEGDVAHCHGLYWTAEHVCYPWEHKSNRNVINALRNAKEITVPSEWVAETVRRDMRVNPHVVWHGIDWEDWTPREHDGYVLWNKNRNVDVCDPTPMVNLAIRARKTKFLTTFLPHNFTGKTPNIKEIGMQPHNIMKSIVEQSMVYLSTTKETFGIGILEAMAAAVPVLGFDFGGNSMIIEHGVTGYLAKPGDYDDFENGLEWCIQNRETVGANAREAVKKYTWDSAAKQVSDIYRKALDVHPYSGKTSVVIPCYNYEKQLPEAVKSAISQSEQPLEVIIVDDGSTDNTEFTGKALAQQNDIVTYVRQNNSGVAVARNTGIELAKGEFICCLDADDKIHPEFIRTLSGPLKERKTLGISYSGILAVTGENKKLSDWPTACDYDRQMSYRSKDNPRGLNQVPTCCLFKKEAWKRTGGYKSKYAPRGAGSEDAEFWTRIMSIGYEAEKTSNKGLFIYSLFSGAVSGAKNVSPDLVEPKWLTLHPWALDKQHNFASMATPTNGLAHLVRSYDEPVVSIVIPVGNGHEKHVYDALDSVESQTIRKWEAIVVWDSENEPNLDAYPYVRLIRNELPLSGAGFSRNRGAEKARGVFLVFLDADDQISPNFLEETLETFRHEESIVYTDYLNSFMCEKEDLEKHDSIVQYNERTKSAVSRGHSSNYDCERAQRQPSKDLFHWCLVTCLIPKAWHDKIGGFDEDMETFEDVLYHWVMARSGYCYTRIDKPLVNYKIHTGNRREKANIYTSHGRAVATRMIKYCKQKLQEITMAGCSGCGGSRRRVNVSNEMERIANTDVRQMNDDNYVMCLYSHPNKGNHRVVGPITRESYGYRGGGNKFLVHRKDIEAQPQFFVPIQDSKNEYSGIMKEQPRVTPPPPQATANHPPKEHKNNLQVEEKVINTDSIPSVSNKKNQLAILPGVTPAILKQLNELGIDTVELLAEMSQDELVKIKGIGENRAEAILMAVSKILSNNSVEESNEEASEETTNNDEDDAVE